MRRLSFCLIIITIFALPFGTAKAGNCPWPNKKWIDYNVKYLGDQIKKEMKYKNVDELVAKFKSTIEDCGGNPSQYGYGRGIYDFWKKEGQENHVSDCGDVRLDQDGGPMTKIPVYDQGGAGICYAFTAAQMIDAWRFANGDKRRSHLTSPMALAAIFKGIYPDENVEEDSNDKNSISTLNAGQAHKTIESGIRFGSCSQKRTGELYKVKGETAEKLARLVDSYKDIQAHPGSLGVASDNILCEFQTVVDKDPPLRELAAQIQESLKLNSAQAYLYDLIGKMCRPPHKIAVRPPAKVSNYYFDSERGSEFHESAVVSNLHGALDGDPAMPAKISYCANMMYDRNTVGIKKPIFGDPARNCKSDTNHASLVIGRRIDKLKGTCQYLVRNTWGTSCHQYPDWECKDGNIWIDRKVMLTNTFGVTRMEKK